MEKETFKSELKEFAKSIIAKYFPTKEKFKDAKLADGTLISYDAEELAVGVIAYVIDTTGAKMPMPKGSYVLEDGTTFDVVDEMGTVDNVVATPEKEEPAEVAPAAPTEQAAAPQAPRTSSTGEPIPTSVIETRTKETKFESEEEKQLNQEIMDEKFTKAVEKFEAEKIEFSKQIEELKDKADKQDELLKEVFKLIEMIGNTPAEAPIETRKNVFKAADVKAEINSFREDLKRLKEETK